MAGKSLEEIWQKMQKDAQEKKVTEQSEIDKINEAREQQRKEWLKRMKMYESVSTVSSAAAGAGGGAITLEWINGYEGTPYNTAWIYPQSDLDNAVLAINSNSLVGPSIGFTYSEVNFTKVDNYTYTFPTLEDVISFYLEMFSQTAITQPVGNQGYSLGVGTILRSRRTPKLKFNLESGITVVEFSLMTQITSQSTLPVGGNSPDGTIGWGSIYVDWNADGIGDEPSDPVPHPYVDPLRFKLNN